MDTTIAISDDTKALLDEHKVHKNESYNDVISRLVDEESQEQDDIMRKLEQIESAQANTVSDALELAEEHKESDPVDYAEIESRVERVMERMVR